MTTTPSSAGRTRFRTGEPAEAQAQSSRAYYPLRLDVLGRPATFDMSLTSIVVGPLTIGELSYGTEVRLDCEELRTAYHVNIPLSGHLESEHRHEVVVATTSTAAVYQPTGNTVLRRWGADCRQLCVKIERAAVESELENMLGRPARNPLEMAAALDLTRGAGRSWRALVRMLATDMNDVDGLIGLPPTGQHLGHSVITGLLLAVGSNYHEELHDPVGPSRPRVVKRVIDAVEADPAEDFSCGDLARIAGVSTRSLQAGFSDHVGMSPMSYLRSVRLDRAHAELVTSDPAVTTVAEVACTWRFTHLGRFASLYRERYGRNPSATLRYGD